MNMTKKTKKKMTLGSEPILIGVCDGIAKYFSTDATLVRIVFVASTIFWGSGLLIYLICYFLMPWYKNKGEIKKENLK